MKAANLHISFMIIKEQNFEKVQPLYNGETYSENANQNRFAITTYEYYPDSEYKIKGLLKA